MAGERRQRAGRFRPWWAAVLRRRPVVTAETASESPGANSPPPEAQSPSGVETTAPPVKSEDVEGTVTTVEMADVYRSLVSNLRDKLGGTINDANADAIARAAAQVYRQEVEPRMWEEKTAHELLDGLGIPRSGAFVPYSLSDRLLLLGRSGSEDVYRAQAHELLDELAVPRDDEAGHEYSLQARLTRLLGTFDGAPVAGGNGNPGGAGDNGDRDAAPGGTDEAVTGPELVDALEAIQRAAGPADADEPPSASPPVPNGAPPATPAPAADLIGLGSLLGTIQEELLEVRQAVESLRQEVRDAVALFQAGAGPGVVPPVVPGVALAEEGPEVVVRRLGDAPDPAAPDAGPPEAAPTVGPDFVLARSGSSNGEGGEGDPPDTALDPPVPAAPVGPHEPTRVLPPVPLADRPASADQLAVEEPVAQPRRSRRVVVLLLLVILLGVLLAAGITAAVVLGWDELESRFLETVTVPALRSGPQPVWGGPGPAS